MFPKAKELEEKYQKCKFMYDIISSTGTGTKLVRSVKKCLEYIGYVKVEDCDNNIEDREDLHIFKNPKGYFIAEVKEINGPHVEDGCIV